MKAANGMGYQRADGYIIMSRTEGKKLQHIEIAERAIGKPLPPRAIVHHVDRDRANNAPHNLVVCPDEAYHKLIHQRMRAHAACGHYDWIVCEFCGKHDEPANLYVRPNRSQGWHRECRNAQLRANYVKKESQ